MSLDHDIFKTLTAGKRLSAEALEGALTAILNGQSNDAQIGALLMALETQGYGANEIRVGTSVMRAHMTPVKVKNDVIDIVGTGGTGLHTLSISTATAIVCAGAGVHVAKHGNRAASSLTGTADTLSELGVNLAITPQQAAECIDEIGLGFLFAPNHHPAMRHVGPARKSLGIRTLFNVLGPLCNPARAKRQLLGVSENSWRAPIAEALRDLGSEHVWIVHGEDGLDEITTTGTTFVTELKEGNISEFEITPESYGFKRMSLDDLRGGHPQDNAKALSNLLMGMPSPYRDIVCLNSGVALMIAGACETIEDGITHAITSIDRGRAKAVLDNLISKTNG